MRTLQEILKDEVSASHPVYVLDTDFDSMDDMELPEFELDEYDQCAA
jgi:hypothetical protein